MPADAPGAIVTAANRGIDAACAREVATRERIPAARYGIPAEFACTAAFLPSDDAASITGQNLRVDGGLTRSV